MVEYCQRIVRSFAEETPENPKRNLRYISGLLILNDLETGFHICIIDCTWITAKRTGVATAVPAKYLAREDSKTLGILGCSAQDRSNLGALMAVCRNLEEVKTYDSSGENLRRYVEEMTAEHRMKVIPVNSPMKTVENCDIVVTAGPILKRPQPVIEASWFKDGCFARPLDFDSYWKPEAMHSMDKLCTDDREQLDYYKQLGYFSDIPKIYADLDEIVSRRRPSREDPNERIMSMNLGIAIEDIATTILPTRKRGKWVPERRFPCGQRAQP